MAAIDVDRLIGTLAQRIGQDFTLRSGKTINISAVRRSGADGGTLIVTGTITDLGVQYVYDNSNPIIWVNCRGGANAAEAAENARAMLDALVLG